MYVIALMYVIIKCLSSNQTILYDWLGYLAHILTINQSVGLEWKMRFLFLFEDNLKYNFFNCKITSNILVNERGESENVYFTLLCG